MIVVGLWIAIVGYGLAYSGYIQLSGGKCSIVDAFRGQCQPGQGRQTSATPQQGQTLLKQQQAQVRQQADLLSTSPIPQQVA